MKTERCALHVGPVARCTVTQIHPKSIPELAWSEVCLELPWSEVFGISALLQHVTEAPQIESFETISTNPRGSSVWICSSFGLHFLIGRSDVLYVSTSVVLAYPKLVLKGYLKPVVLAIKKSSKMESKSLGGFSLSKTCFKRIPTTVTSVVLAIKEILENEIKIHQTSEEMEPRSAPNY